MSRPRRVVLPEDLIGPVDEVHNHIASLSQQLRTQRQLDSQSSYRIFVGG
jgi:hypothetical protein